MVSLARHASTAVLSWIMIKRVLLLSSHLTYSIPLFFCLSSSLRTLSDLRKPSAGLAQWERCIWIILVKQKSSCLAERWEEAHSVQMPLWKPWLLRHISIGLDCLNVGKWLPSNIPSLLLPVWFLASKVFGIFQACWLLPQKQTSMHTHCKGHLRITIQLNIYVLGQQSTQREPTHAKVVHADPEARQLGFKPATLVWAYEATVLNTTPPCNHGGVQMLLIKWFRLEKYGGLLISIFVPITCFCWDWVACVFVMMIIVFLVIQRCRNTTFPFKEQLLTAATCGPESFIYFIKM